ncbi:MAG: carbohydrate kinase family protein, partial [Theionarchaea archaeon]|nr:carbohydrate kinase family protein [Theionarchaea archaeon]
MLDLLIFGVVDIHTTIHTPLKSGILNDISEFSERFTGSALHMAINASLLGVNVGIICPVGRDAVGLLDVFRRYSIDYSHIILSSEKNPNLIDFHASRRQYTLYYKGARGDVTPKSIEREYLTKARAIHICFPDENLVRKVINLAKKEKVFTSVDTSFVNANADIKFTQDKSIKGRNIIYMDFKKEIRCNKLDIPVFIKDIPDEGKVKDAFMAAFLSRYIKSENLGHAALYGSCAAYFCSQSGKRVL